MRTVRCSDSRGDTCPAGGCTCRELYLLGGLPARGCTYLGVYLLGRVPAQGGEITQGVYLPRVGGYTYLGGVPAWGIPAQGGGVYLPGGVPTRGCKCQGVYLLGDVSQHTLRQTPPPLWTEWLSDACENITLPQLRCGR